MCAGVNAEFVLYDPDAIMSIAIVRLGSPRRRNEGVRLGTVRRPPRGVPRSEFARRDFYDLWLPALSPSRELVARAQASRDEESWRMFERRFRREMQQPDAARLLDLLAAFSHQTNFSISCYCEDETRCHRSISGNCWRSAAQFWRHPRW